MVDIARDPRWGRIAEGSGEDPLLGSLMAPPVCGDSREAIPPPMSRSPHVQSTLPPMAGRRGEGLQHRGMSERTLREVYLPPIKPPWMQGRSR